MELHGSKDYFNCSKAVLVTNGSIILNAKDVAKKLGIELKHVEPNEEFCNNSKKKEKAPFDLIWEEYIFPLKGKTLERSNGKSNRIIDVNWGEVVRETSIGNKQSINIEIFKLAINKILGSGKISRKTINEEYARRASSGIVLILSQIPFFIKTENPSGLLLNETKCQEFLKNKASKIKGI